jgi:hypothetical protein
MRPHVAVVGLAGPLSALLLAVPISWKRKPTSLGTNESPDAIALNHRLSTRSAPWR